MEIDDLGPDDWDDERAPDIRLRPALWNPNAAAGWSLLLTPAFGAYLHAANWRTLGFPDRAGANMLWFWGMLVYMAVVFGSLFLPDSKIAEGAMRAAGIGILLGWYGIQGRAQALFVTQELKDDYVRKSWSVPLLWGFGGMIAYLAAAGVCAAVLLPLSTEELAEELKPMILEEWHKQPRLGNATIRKITLTHKEGPKYVGDVEAVINGMPMRFPLDVDYDGDQILWTLGPNAGP